MKSTIINPEILAQRLEVAARVETQNASACRGPLQELHLEHARECREWAQALRNVCSLGFEGDGIEVLHD